MPERTLNQQQAFDAFKLLESLDPDDCSEAGVLESVIWNRKALEPHAHTYERRYQGLIGTALQTEDGEVVEVTEEGDTHPLEAELGVKLDLDEEGFAQLDEQLGELQNETVEVTLATEPVSALREVSPKDAPGEKDQLDRWHFMLDVDV